MATIRLLNNNGLTFLSLLLMFSHLLVAHNCSGQRFSRLWWYDLKSNGSSLLHQHQQHHTLAAGEVNPGDHQAPPSWIMDQGSGTSYNVEPDDMDDDDVDRQQKANILNSLQMANLNNNFLPTSANTQRPTADLLSATQQNPDEYYFGPSDDELMTQASKLSSHMTRIMAPTNVGSGAGGKSLRSQYEPASGGSLDSASASASAPTTTSTTFDDVISNGEQLFQMPTTTVQPSSIKKQQQLQQQQQVLKKIVDQVLLPKPAATNPRPFFTSQPFGQAASSSSFNGNFAQPHQRRNADQINNYSDRIWNFFDSSMSRGGGGGSNQRIPSWKTFGGAGANGMSNSNLEDDGGFNSVVDSYIEKLKKRQSQQLKAKNEKLQKNSKGVSAGKSKKDQDNKNVLSLNLNRRKNTEEKEKFRQLIQNIFDSTPRKTYSYGAENGYSKIGATTSTADDTMDSGEMMVDQQENEPPSSSEEDVLKNEKEENVLLKDNTDSDDDSGANNNNDDLVDKIAATNNNDDGLGDDLDREERAGDTDTVQGKEIEDDAAAAAGAVGAAAAAADDNDELLNQVERQLDSRDASDDTSDNDNSPASETDRPDTMEDLGGDQENQYLKHRPSNKNSSTSYHYGYGNRGQQPPKLQQRSITGTANNNLDLLMGKRKKSSSFFRSPSQFTTNGQRSSAAVHRHHQQHPKSAVLMLATTTESSQGGSGGGGRMALGLDDMTTISPLFTMAPPSVVVAGDDNEESLNLSNEHLLGFGENFSGETESGSDQPSSSSSSSGAAAPTTPPTTTVTTTGGSEIDPELKGKLITKRKQQMMGKWLDTETFDLRHDDDDDDDDLGGGGGANGVNSDVNDNGRDNKAATSSSSSSPSSSSSSSSSSVLQTTNHRRSAALQIDFQPLVRSRTMPSLSPRIIRQNSRLQLSNNNNNLNTNDDDIAQLARTLPGVPGQDYPVFGTIPRTRFSCHDHKWPGYYADVDTQCQVFHICQIGNRKASFLCPNGTMFNQQLFICDWWHNVQCDEVPNHYELNAHIYDHNWESTRLQTTGAVNTNTITPKSQRISIRRMAVLEDGAQVTPPPAAAAKAVEIANNNTGTDDFQSPTTTAIPLSINLTTTIQPVMITTIPTTTESAPSSLTETVFGARRSINDHQLLDNNNNNSWKPMVEHEERPKRKIVPGTKGGSSSGGGGGNSGDLSKFSKLIQANKQLNKQQQQQQQNHFGTTFGQWNSSNKLSSGSSSSSSSTASNHRHKFASLAAKSTPLPQLFAQNVRQPQPSASASVSSSQRLQMTPAPVHMSTRPGKYYRT